jgi:hypothetical protein
MARPRPRGRRIGARFLAIPLLIVTLVIGYLIWGLIVDEVDARLGSLNAVLADGRRQGGQLGADGAARGRRPVPPVHHSVRQIVSFVVFLATKQRRAIHDYVAGRSSHDPNRVYAPK